MEVSFLKSLYVLKVYEDSLCCLRAKIYYVLGIFCYPLESLKHQVKFSDLCEIVLSTGRTWYFMFFDKSFHLFM